MSQEVVKAALDAVGKLLASGVGDVEVLALADDGGSTLGGKDLVGALESTQDNGGECLSELDGTLEGVDGELVFARRRGKLASRLEDSQSTKSVLFFLLSYSNSLDNLFSLPTLVLINSIAFDTVGHVVEQRAKVSSLKELVEGDELEGSCRAIAERSRQSSAGELSTSLHSDLLKLVIVGAWEAIVRRDLEGSGEKTGKGRADKAC
ncbi:hypothetical protein HG530_000998 [Fusarium avenaceum]|nr:hypothetical protein HG530_000998 [Fusarium avenaceum]